MPQCSSCCSAACPERHRSLGWLTPAVHSQLPAYFLDLYGPTDALELERGKKLSCGRGGHSQESACLRHLSNVHFWGILARCLCEPALNMEQLGRRPRSQSMSITREVPFDTRAPRQPYM